jgi:double-stranded uracil-DNA glycosylase
MGAVEIRSARRTLPGGVADVAGRCGRGLTDHGAMADEEGPEGRTIPDVIAPGLQVLFCGINPGRTSGATGRHFAHPGNRFWRALYEGGWTPRLLRPDEQRELLDLGLGITNLVARTTAKASELSGDELRAGGRRLRQLAARYRPSWIAIVGVTAYRTAFGERHAVLGEQEATCGAARLWVLPNPSGLNAHVTTAGLASEFARFRDVVQEPGRRAQPGRRRGIAT